MVRLALAEDNDFLAHSIQERISIFSENFDMKFRAVNGAELIGKLVDNATVDIVLMDIEMPEMNGIKATELVKKQYPHIKVVMLTVFDDEENIFNAICAGADGYLLKDSNPQQLYDAVSEILEGGAPMSPSIAKKALKMLRNPGQVENKSSDIELTKRELDVLQQLSTGLDYQKIADNLFISSGTVRKHIENIYRKLQVHNKVEAITKASKEGLI